MIEIKVRTQEPIVKRSKKKIVMSIRTTEEISYNSKNGKAYKCNSIGNVRMFPSDPTGSLDDFFPNFKFLQEFKWKRL